MGNNKVIWVIHYRSFSSPTSRTWSDRKEVHDSDESFFKSWDNNDYWGSYMVCAMYVTRNGETVWSPDRRRRYSWEKDTSIDRIKEFRPKEEAVA